MRRIVGVVCVAALIAMALVGALTFTPVLVEKATATPVATNEATYTAFGRIFPDPHGCRDQAPESSPFAKGLVCATDFMQYEEFTRGSKFLEATFPRFVKWYTLHKDFNCRGRPVSDPKDGCRKWRSAGLPVTFDEHGDTFVRERRRLHLVRITDESVPDKNKKFFIYPLSIHGIERAGLEGGIRAAEDLATWAACDPANKVKVPDYVDCSSPDNEGPHPVLEATPNKSLSATQILKKAVVFFQTPNPDGWLRGDRFRDRVPGASFYQRYNGNGVDLNRDWPTQGFTFRPYTPASEPETKAYTTILPKIGPKTPSGDANWDGGIDLHGQLIDRAFSFTLMGASERDYDKNQRILQTVKGAWADAEKRLEWSPVIKPNDAPQDDPRLYGVQWGTVWDTIDYTITGGLGDWLDSKFGLNADGIDNEMSMSHLSNCGVGSCYLTEFEQLHVDGNKSLIYAQLNYALLPEDKTFETKGRVAYLKNRGVIKAKTDRFAPPPKFTKLPPQDDILDETLDATNDWIYEFDVKSPKNGVYNGGIAVSLTCANSPVGTNCELTDAYLERKLGKNEEPDPGTSEWQTVNSYFLQGAGYSATGKALHANLPTPGRWRVRLETTNDLDVFDADIFFSKEKGWPDPGQMGYRVTTMKFWKMMERFAEPALEPLGLAEIKRTGGWKNRYNSIVITNRVYSDLASKLKAWVADGGNLVLTDKAIGMLAEMGLVPKSGIDFTKEYAGYVNFETREKTEGEDQTDTYGDPLARNINQPGAAEGGQEESDQIEGEENHRHQTYEPVPIGYAIQTPDDSDAFESPVWYVNADALAKAKGRAAGTTDNFSNVSLGEIKVGKGQIRFIGAVLPDPTEKFDHPFGLANHSLTYSGYQLIHNALKEGL